VLDLRAGLGDLHDAVDVVWYDISSDPDALWVYWQAEDFRQRAERLHRSIDNSAAIWIVPAHVDAVDETGELLRDQVLPEVSEWLSLAFSQSDAWQALSHSKRWAIRDGGVTSRTHDESARHHSRRRY
jgi:hypothetical protein